MNVGALLGDTSVISTAAVRIRLKFCIRTLRFSLFYDVCFVSIILGIFPLLVYPLVPLNRMCNYLVLPPTLSRNDAGPHRS